MAVMSLGVEPNAGPERRLEELRIGGRDAIPAQRILVGREQLCLVEAPAGNAVPGLAGGKLGVDLPFPQDFQRLAEAARRMEARAAANAKIGARKPRGRY